MRFARWVGKCGVRGAQPRNPTILLTKKTKLMNKKEIIDAIAMLAQSQGFYGRLLEQIRDNDEALDYLESQNFGDIVDMVLFLEQ